MKELKKNKRLTYLVIALVAIILVGVVSTRKPAVTYKLSTAEMLKAINDSNSYITPKVLNEMIVSKNTEIVLVDVRSALNYKLTHIESSINIPVRDLLAKESLKQLKEITEGKQTIVLIGESQQQAIGPWMMLKQTGIDNIKVFTGVYAQLGANASDSIIARLPQYAETVLIDTSALRNSSAPVMSEKAIVKPDAKPAKKAVTPVKVEESSGGGC